VELLGVPAVTGSSVLTPGGLSHLFRKRQINVRDFRTRGPQLIDGNKIQIQI